MPALAGAHVVVTGGAGFVGSHLVDALLSAGVAGVVVFDDLRTGSWSNLAHHADDPRLTTREHDVTGYIEVDGPVDVVLHLASPASPVDYLRLPIPTMKAGSLGTLNALGLAKARGARFLLASTSEVYGDPEVHPQPEDYFGRVDTTSPRAVYDEAKRFAEALTLAYHRAHGVDTRIARIFNTYGPRMRTDDGRVVPAFVGAAVAGLPLPVHGDGSQTRTLCHVDDLVAGLLALLAVPAGTVVDGVDVHEPVNLGGTEELAIIDLAFLVAELAGSDAGVRFEPAAVDDPTRRCPDLTRARTLLDHRALVSTRDGLARTIEWYRSLDHDPDPEAVTRGAQG